MRVLYFTPLLLIVPLAAARVAGAAVSAGDAVAVRAIDGAFYRTQNLLRGEGRCHRARRPAVPSLFHVQRGGEENAMLATFAPDEELGLWAEAHGDVADPLAPAGSVFYADAARSRPAGHALVAASGEGLPSLVKTDVSYLAGSLKGVSYGSDVTIAEDGTGAVKATGRHPSAGAYALTGRWNAANVGTWTQRWDMGRGSWEVDAYRNADDGTGAMKVQTSEGIDLHLSFAANRSGEGTVTGNRPGLPAKLKWDNEGSGSVVWSNGSKTEFEDWKFADQG